MNDTTIVPTDELSQCQALAGRMLALAELVRAELSNREVPPAWRDMPDLAAASALLAVLSRDLALASIMATGW